MKRSITILVLLLTLAPVVAGQQSTASTETDLARIDAATRSAVIDSICDLVNKYYVTIDKIDAVVQQLRQNLRDGKYDQYDELDPFIRQLTEDLRGVSSDNHFGVWPIETSLTLAEESAEERLKWEARARYNNYGFGRLERLPGNIGYLELEEFESPRLAGATAVAAMNFLGNTDALIIDLRQNGGGYGETGTLICSYLFDSAVHLSSDYDRQTDKTNQTWTQPYVQGPKMVDVPVYVLQSSRTFSASEYVSYSLQAQKRATVIGETSRGGGHPVNDFNLPEFSICVSIPIGESINPVTGKNWEGVGVTPDIPTTSEKALAAACVEAAKAILDRTEDADRKKTLELVLERYNAELNPAVIDSETIARLSGTYQYSESHAYDVLYENGALLLRRDGRVTYTLLPCGDDRCAIKEREGAVQFHSAPDGKITGLTTIYPDIEFTYKRVK